MKKNTIKHEGITYTYKNFEVNDIIEVGEPVQTGFWIFKNTREPNTIEIGNRMLKLLQKNIEPRTDNIAVIDKISKKMAKAIKNK